MQTILVVDDEPMIREVIVDMLNLASHHAIVAANGAEALACLENIRPALVLSDVKMPVMDGIALFRTMQAHAVYSAIPVVLMSSVHNRKDVAECKPTDFLAKPFDMDELLATVSQAINHE